jgi:hypothetical protein
MAARGAACRRPLPPEPRLALLPQSCSTALACDPRAQSRRIGDTAGRGLACPRGEHRSAFSFASGATKRIIRGGPFESPNMPLSLYLGFVATYAPLRHRLTGAVLIAAAAGLPTARRAA